MINQQGLRFAAALWLTMCLTLSATRIALANDSLADAHRLHLTGRYEEAIDAYEDLTEQEPVASAIGVVRCYRAVGKYDDAVNLLREEIDEHAESSELLSDLAQLAFERGDYEAAQQHVDEALKKNNEQLLARWILAELHRVQGRLKEAQDGYLWFVRYYNRAQKDIKDPEDVRLIGLAAAQYARWIRNSSQFNFLVNRLYPKALELDKNYWPALLESGLLFVEKYNEGDAQKEFNAALAINPNAAELHAARARLALLNFDLDAAKTAIDRALEINPRLIVAHQLHADLLMANFRLPEAAEVLEGARKLNPADEDTLGRLAAAYGAIDGLRNDPSGTRMGVIIDEAVKRNEHCGQFFFALAETLDLLRKFPQAARYYDESQTRMPQLLGPRGKLGLMYMRLGEEAKAADLLKESFKIDPFNVRVKNMLAVLDVLQGYAVIETDHFVIRFDRGTDEILAQYAARYLEEEVYPTTVKQLGYEPEGKTLLEIFNQSGRTSGHGWFSARMVGLPYIGTVGACAGKMVAIASPNGTPSKYNWARVLRHEFVHVVNLQQTDFNIPHWFTEALAVLHEDLPRPTEWNRILAKRLHEGTMFDLDTINFGFVRPASGDDWTLAYCQAELYAQYMVETHGDDALGKLLDAYANNLSTANAIQRCFAVGIDEFETGYGQHVRKIVEQAGIVPSQQEMSFNELEKAVKANPDDANVTAQLAYEYLQRNANAEARRLALKAQELDEKHQLAAYVLARLYLSIGDVEQALNLLEVAVDEESPQANALGLLAGLKLKAGDFQAAERLYQLGSDRFPHDDKWLRSLTLVYLKSGDSEKLSAALIRLVDLDYDNATICKKLTELALERKDYATASNWANRALHIDVMDAELHAMLAESLANLKDNPAAIGELEMAVRLDAQQLAWRMKLAEMCIAAGEKAKARTALQQLLDIDADYPGARDLLESLPE